MGINRDRAQVFKSAFSQVPAQAVRQFVAHFPKPLMVLQVHQNLMVGKRPDLLIKASKLTNNLQIGPGIANNSLHFSDSIPTQTGLKQLSLPAKNALIATRGKRYKATPMTLAVPDPHPFIYKRFLILTPRWFPNP